MLRHYREPSHRRSLFELLVSLLPFIALWGLAWYSLSIGYWLAPLISAINGGFLVRLFIIQHDCGHGAFFSDRRANDWVGRCLGVVTLTPYEVWRRAHSAHHASAGNLDKRGLGDILTLTVSEYRELSALGRLRYRVYRHPLFLFGMVPSYLYLLQNRLPVGLMDAGPKYWVSAMGTNAAIALLLGAVAYLGGPAPLLLIFLPSTIVAASIGLWLFYVQHQFEDTCWDTDEDWQVHDAALHGSSHYVLPLVLRWFTANIGVHHVHHLYSRIPFYRLPEILRDHPVLAQAQRLTLTESFGCVGLNLWDDRRRRLLSFAEARLA